MKLRLDGSGKSWEEKMAILDEAEEKSWAHLARLKRERANRRAANDVEPLSQRSA